MLQDNNNFSENDSLAVITTMINRAKNHFGETGTLYLLWGWVIFICCMVQFIMIRFFENEQAYFVWYLTWVAAIYQVYYIVRKKRTEKVKTYTEDIVGMVWLTFFFCLSLTLFILLKYQAYWAIHPCILVLYGMPTFISGSILKFTPLRVGGVICWLLSILATFVDHEYQLLLLSLAVVAAWIVPGYLLRSKFKTQLS